MELSQTHGSHHPVPMRDPVGSHHPVKDKGMKESSANRNLRQILKTVPNYSFIFWLAAFIVVVVFLLTTTLAAHYKNRRLGDHYYQLQKEINNLKTTNKALCQEIKALTTDPVYLEKTIRETLHMGNENEIALQKKDN